MTIPQISPYGAWTSPITSELIVASTIGLGDLTLQNHEVYWTELRPTEKGRSVLVKYDAEGQVHDVTPSPFNVRSRVHEYGGAAYLITPNGVYFCNAKDQRLYHQTIGSVPQALTPDTSTYRYANAIWDAKGDRLICVREDHRAHTNAVINCLVSIDISGKTRSEGNSGNILVEGNDFYATPCLSPDGTQLAWLTWNHPNMPWDGTELWVAVLQADGT